MSGRAVTIVTFVAALAVAGLLSHYASSHPDGLMQVAEAQGFAATESASATQGSPLAGYAVAGLENARLSGGLAGIVGCVACFVLVTCLTRRRA